jgi:predicted nucleic acid-binding protein
VTIDFDSSARIYVDTNIWIYYIESHPTFREKIDEIFERADVSGATLVTGEIAIAECLVRPSRQGETAIIQLYEDFFEESGVEFVKLDGALARRAALASGVLGLKLIDAIHYISARESGCTHILTRDGKFKSGPNLVVVGLD